MSSPKDPILTKSGLLVGGGSMMNVFVDSLTQSLSKGSGLGPETMQISPIPMDQVDSIRSNLNLSGGACKSIFADTLMTFLGETLNVPGQTPLLTIATPIFDPSSLLPNQTLPIPQPANPTTLKNWIYSTVTGQSRLVDFPLDPVQITKFTADLAGLLGLSVPQLTSLVVPSIPAIPQVPTVDVMSLPGLSHLAGLALPPGFVTVNFVTEMLKVPTKIFTTYLTDVNKMIQLVSGISNIPKLIIDEVMSMVTLIPGINELLSAPTKPIMLVGGLLAIIKFISSAISSVLLGSIMGAGGLASSMPNLVADFF